MNGTNGGGIQKARNKGGAPLGNRNNQRHGLRSGRLPAKCKYIENAVNALRRELEDAVVEARGSISKDDACCINSACKWEQHGQLCRRWLRLEGDKLPVSERMRLSEGIAKASSARDKEIRLLNLSAAEKNPWLVVDGQVSNASDLSEK